MSYFEQKTVIINAATAISKCHGDRHVCYLTRIAHEQTNDSLEEKAASKINKLLVQFKKKTDFPTPKDIDKKEMWNKMKSVLFTTETMTPIEAALWNAFSTMVETKHQADLFSTP